MRSGRPLFRQIRWIPARSLFTQSQPPWMQLHLQQRRELTSNGAGKHDSARESAQPTTTANSTIDRSPTTSSAWNTILDFWNESSGTNEIYTLKQLVSNASRAFDKAQEDVLTARRDHAHHQLQQQDVQRQHAALSRRRHEWTADDAQHYATLLQREVAVRDALDEAARMLQARESQCTQLQHDYIDAMRKRYHEEQIWQEKWRIVGTYGTWSLIGLNTLIFLASQYFHWQRETNKLLVLQNMLDAKLGGVGESQVAVVQEQQHDNHDDNDDDATDGHPNKDDAAPSMPVSESAADDNTAQDPPQQEHQSASNEDRLDKLRAQALQYIARIDVPSAVLGATVATSCFVVGLLVARPR